MSRRFLRHCNKADFSPVSILLMAGTSWYLWPEETAPEISSPKASPMPDFADFLFPDTGSGKLGCFSWRWDWIFTDVGPLVPNRKWADRVSPWTFFSLLELSPLSPAICFYETFKRETFTFLYFSLYVLLPMRKRCWAMSGQSVHPSSHFWGGGGSS